MKTVKIIPSKSDAHRAYISAAMAHIQKRNAQEDAGDSAELPNEDTGRSDYFNCVICDETSEDIEATKRCLNSIISAVAEKVTVTEPNEGKETLTTDLYCGESGSTLRFLLPVVGALGMRAVFHTEGRLIDRPVAPLVDELAAHGMRISVEGSRILAEGKLLPGEYLLPGNISSQFITGLLFALPIMEGDSEIIVEGTLESSPYVDMTVDTLGKFGVSIEDETLIEFAKNADKDKGASGCNSQITTKRVFYVKGNQLYKAPGEYNVQGDWSNAAFWLAMGALGKEAIRVEGLSTGTYQGDESIWDAIDVFGIEYKIGRGFFEAYPSRDRMQGITWSASETPDMVPVLALLGAMAKGETRIVNAARLRLKESDRLHTVSETLKALGVMVEELSDGLIVHGCSRLSQATLESYGDHRIAMMIAAASVALDGGAISACDASDSVQGGEKIQLSGWNAVNKSYPSFFKMMSELGLDGNLELI